MRFLIKYNDIIIIVFNKMIVYTQALCAVIYDFYGLIMRRTTLLLTVGMLYLEHDSTNEKHQYG